MDAVEKANTGATTAPQKTLPISFVALSTIGAIALAAGVVGLVAPEIAPPLASSTVAWSLIGVGVIMDVLAFMQLLAARVPSRKS